MWVSKIVGANKDLAIGIGQTMTGTLTFTQNGEAYSLAGITATFKIYKPGVTAPVLTLTDGNGLVKGASTIVFNKVISLASMMYRYELHFDYGSGEEAIMMDGGFWVRKSGVTDNSSTSVVVTQNTINIELSVSITREDGNTRLYSTFFDTTEGENELTHNTLNNIEEIIACIREEGSYKPVTGTPAGRQVKYTNGISDGTLVFPVSFPFNPGEQIHLIYKKLLTT